MGIRSLQTGCSTAARSAAGLALAGILSTSAWAAPADEVTQLRPYQVQYLTKQYGLKVKVTRTLARSAENYTLTETGKVMMQSISQRSEFSVDGLELVPTTFDYQLSGVVSRKRAVEFTGEGPVRSLYKDEWYEFERQPGMLDRLSQQEQFRLLLLNDPTPDENFSVTIVDGRKVKTYELMFEKQETLQTALGPVDTLHFSRKHKDDRSTDIWLAPQWDYLMVRTLHVEDDKPVEAVITAGNIDGKALETLRRSQ